MKDTLIKHAYGIAAALLALAAAVFLLTQPVPPKRIQSEEFQPEQRRAQSFLQEWQVFGLAGPQNRSDSLAEAVELYQNEQYAAADSALGFYLSRYPTDSIAGFYHGLSLLYQNKHEAALQALAPLTELSDFEWRDDARWYAALSAIHADQTFALGILEKISRDPSSGYRHAAATVLATQDLQQGGVSMQLQATQPPDTTGYALLIETQVPWWKSGRMRQLILLLFGLGAGSLIFWRERYKKQLAKNVEKAVQARTSAIREEKEVLQKERDRSEELLLNILPAETMEELKATGQANARRHEMVTVLFSDFQGFTQISEILPPEQLVADLDHCFKAFDRIIQLHGLEKIKTVGDCYVCAGGLNEANQGSAVKVVQAARDMIKALQSFNANQLATGKPAFEARIGIHTGPVVAGIVGIKKYAYDIWGDTVNIAARMEQSSEGGRINLSDTTYELVKNEFTCTHRGKVEAKGKGLVDMYFVE